MQFIPQCIENCLIVDIGHENTRIMGIFDNRPIFPSILCEYIANIAILLTNLCVA